ncbi:MAG: DUF1573 domain-containing protein [Bacteroidota bacterium]
MKIRFYLLGVALSCLFALPSFAQDTPIAPTSPATAADLYGPTTNITFEETTYDFGTIDEGVLVKHVFTFTNTGDEPLILSDAKGSCGCTVPKWPREAIAPGETASITVEFNSKNKKGKRNQRVTITANTHPPQTFVYLTGEVIPKSGDAESYIEFSEKEEVPLDPSCFAIYPNPTAELLRLDLEDHLGEVVMVNILSNTGQVMAARRIPAAGSIEEFSVGHYPPGTYIAKVEVEGKQPESKCFVVVE